MKAVDEADLHAYVDGLLDPARRAEVEAWLARHPQDAMRVQSWIDQNLALHEQLDGVLDEPIPPQLLRATRRPSVGWRSAPRWAAAVVALAAVGIGGYALGLRNATPVLIAAEPLPRAATLAYAVYAPEQRHPVEVTAADSAHLVDWLSKRLGRPVQAPDLTTDGFELLGGRLLSGDSGPVALFMYQDQRGRRITLYVRREGAADTASGSDDTTAFSYALEDGIGAFYWIDGRSGYALTGELDKRELLELATLTYRQLEDTDN